MSIRAAAVAVAALVWAVPAAAQQRGSVEFGAFGTAASFDNALSLTNGVGVGGRVGVFLDPRWSLEFEKTEMRAHRPNGLASVNVGIMSARLVTIPFKTGGLSLFAGLGGGVSTETNFLHTYGVDLMGGAKIALRNNAALRIDGLWDWLANEDWKAYRSVRVGISLFRNPIPALHTVTSPAPAPMMVARADSVSADETRRLRNRDAALTALRDSLRNTHTLARAVAPQVIPMRKDVP